VVDKWWISGG